MPFSGATGRVYQEEMGHMRYGYRCHNLIDANPGPQVKFLYLRDWTAVHQGEYGNKG